MEDNENEVLDMNEAEPEVPDVTAPENEDVTSEAPEAPEPTSQETTFDGDINKLPPELQTVAKGFQASYTKKMQALQTAFEGLNSHRERLSLLDKALSGDPGARKQIAQIIGQPQHEPEQFNPNTIPDSFKSSQELLGWMNNWLQAKIAPVLQQVQQPLQYVQTHVARQAAMAEIEQMRAKYPDFDSHLQQMVEIREKDPDMPLEQCYRIASWRPATPPEQITRKPGARPTAVRSKDENRPMSFEEASELALKELGVKRR